MYFTQDDYRKIEQWLTKNSIKDTEFNEAIEPLNGNETIALVQNGHNVKASLKDFISQLFLLGVSDFLNVSEKFNEKYISLSQAIALIPFRSRKIGQVITFLDESGEWKIYQFQGERVNQWNNTTLWIDLLQAISASVNIVPDEEDITGVLQGERNLLKFRDKNYNKDDYSGLGRVFLRKNLTTVTDPSTMCKISTNLLTQEMISREYTIYIIQYDYTLNGNTIVIPKGSILDFQGGSIDNGTLSFKDDTKIKEHFIGNATIEGNPYYIDYTPDEEDITIVKDVIKFKDKEYNASEFSGLGRVYLRKNISNGKNILTQDMVNKSNTRYIIQYDYDLNGAEITIPEGCILDFQGGVISNGTIDGEYTKIKAELDKIFENILLVGSFNTDYIAVEWFGASASSNDNADYIQSALDNAFTIKANSVRFGTGTYRFSKPLVVRGSSNYVLGEQYNRVLGNGPQSTTLVYTRGSSYKDIYCAIFLESDTHDEGATYNIVLNGFKIIQSNPSADSYGIYSLAGLGCCEISDITMYTMHNGIWFNTDIWQCTLRHLFIHGGNDGIHMNRYGTSNTFSRLYMYGQTGIAYFLKGIYQHFENLACDQCTGICYYFLQCQATVDGLGIESPNARVGIIIESYSDLNISSATILQITRDFNEDDVYNSYIVVNNKSRAVFRNSCLGGSYAQTFSGNSNIHAYWVNSYKDSSGENKSYIEFENCRFLGNWAKGIQQPLANFIASPTIVTHSGNNHTPFNYFNNNSSEPQYPFIGKFEDGNDNINGVNNPDRLNIPPIFFNTHQATPLRDLNGNDVAYFQTVKDALFIPKVKGDYVAFICDEAGDNLLQSKFTPVYKRGYAIGTSDERPPKTADFTSTTKRNACCERFEGQIMYDSTLKKMILFNGAAWVNLDGTALS